MAMNLILLEITVEYGVGLIITCFSDYEWKILQFDKLITRKIMFYRCKYDVRGRFLQIHVGS